MANSSTENLKAGVIKLKKMNYTNFDNITDSFDHVLIGTTTYKFEEEELDFLNSIGLVPVNYDVEVPEQFLPETLKEVSNSLDAIVAKVSASTVYRIVNNLAASQGFMWRARIFCIERDAFITPEMIQYDQRETALYDKDVAISNINVTRNDKPSIYRYHPVNAFDFDLEIANVLNTTWSGVGASNKGDYNFATDFDSMNHNDGWMLKGANAYKQTYSVAAWSGSLTEVNAYENARDSLKDSLNKLITDSKFENVKKYDPDLKANGITQSFTATISNTDLSNVLALSQQATANEIYALVVWEDGTDPFPSGSSPVYDDTLTEANCYLFGQIMGHNITENGVQFSCKRLILEEGFQNCLTTRIA